MHSKVKNRVGRPEKIIEDIKEIENISELIVFVFPTDTGASEMDETIHQLKKEELIDLKDAAVVIRKPDGKIKLRTATLP
jgi:uncharacterized membrane protein